jgi:hypothetical protein
MESLDIGTVKTLAENSQPGSQSEATLQLTSPTARVPEKYYEFFGAEGASQNKRHVSAETTPGSL